MIEIAIGGLLGGLVGALALGAIIYYMMRSDKITELVEEIAQEAQSNEALAMNLYKLGGIIGSGAASGMGIQKKGGKYGFNDLILEIAGRYIGNLIPQSGQAGEEQRQLQKLDRFGNPTQS